MPCYTYLTHWINNGLVRLTNKPCIKCDITGVAAIVYVCLIIPSKTEHHVAFKSSFTKKCWPSVSISLTCLSIHIRKIEIWGFSTIFNNISIILVIYTFLIWSHRVIYAVSSEWLWYWIDGHCDIKHIFTLPLITITAVSNVSTYIITNITACSSTFCNTNDNICFRPSELLLFYIYHQVQFYWFIMYICHGQEWSQTH